VAKKYKINLDDYIVTIPQECGCCHKAFFGSEITCCGKVQATQRYLNKRALYSTLCDKYEELTELRKYYDTEEKKCYTRVYSATMPPMSSKSSESPADCCRGTRAERLSSLFPCRALGLLKERIIGIAVMRRSNKEVKV
jgi:hypothetical protein